MTANLNYNVGEVKQERQEIELKRLKINGEIDGRRMIYLEPTEYLLPHNLVLNEKFELKGCLK